MLLLHLFFRLMDQTRDCQYTADIRLTEYTRYSCLSVYGKMTEWTYLLEGLWLTLILATPFSETKPFEWLIVSRLGMLDIHEPQR